MTAPHPEARRHWSSTPARTDTRRRSPAVSLGLRDEGLDVDLRQVSAATDVDPVAYDLVVGASLHRQCHQREIVAWAARRR